MKIFRNVIYLIVILLSSCNMTNDSQEQGINIQLNLPSRATINIKSIYLKIEASDMDTMEASTTETADASLADTNTINVEVPTGNDRTFSIIVTLDDGSTLSGSKTKDIKSTTSSVYIELDYDILSSTISAYSDSSSAYTIKISNEDGDTSLVFYADDGTSYKITADITGSDYEVISYMWYIDGHLQDGEESVSIDITGSDYTVGSHELTALVTIDDILYSKSIYFIVYSTMVEEIDEPY